MRSEPAHLSGISIDFAGIPPKRDENLGRKGANLEDDGGSKSERIVKIQFFLRAMTTSITKTFTTIKA